MSEWKPIDFKPLAPVQVELFCANGFLFHDGQEVSAVVTPYRDERRMMAYWDGETFRHMGTGHEVVEFSDHPPEWKPTHWRPLPPPPAT